VISGNNVPLNQQSFDSDFTVDSYRELLVIAKQRYAFANYGAIPWGQRFVLWRHDCDYSLNRAHALARVEAAEGVSATYFVNPHSEFYNLFEKTQHSLVLEILGMGHGIGLHFDAAFHDVSDETQLSDLVHAEAALLERLYGVRPTAFSFHNPVAAHLSCEAETYGDMVNCYSLRFKTAVPYCSDSNGYWRFRRLRDVLTEATDPCLQVLTHPGWWQEVAMPPRQRIFRSIFGRAAATLRDYDYGLELHKRQNLAGVSEKLRFLKAAHPRLVELCDYLWNAGYLQSLFVELWRLHERQINKFCKAELRKQWRVPAVEVNAFFESPSLAIDGWRLFTGVFGKTWQGAVGLDDSRYRSWGELRNTLTHGRASAPRQRLEDGCVFMCSTIQSLADWGKAQPIQYDGIAHLGSIGIPTYKTADGSLTDRLEEVADEIPNFPNKKWEQFKAEMSKVGAGETARGAVL
jgi:hypothetical protein